MSHPINAEGRGARPAESRSCMPGVAGDRRDPNDKVAAMDSLKLIQTLLREVAQNLESPTPSSKRQVVRKLNRVSALAATLALTLELQRG